MQNDDRKSDSEIVTKIKNLSAKELTRQRGRDIVVPEDKTLELTPSSGEFLESFARVQVSSFEDAQIMGFVPRKLTEDKVMKAIAEDDALAYKMAARRFNPSAGCGCNHSESESNKVVSLRSTYAGFRRRNNPTLAGLVSEKIGIQLDWDSSLPSSVRKWAINARVGINIIALLLADITINRNSTLAIDAGTKSLWAHDIWIHRSGKMIQSGSYMRVWANSLNSFNNMIDASAVVDLKKHGIPWQLEH